jgi:two-component system, response regulator YesN
MYNVIIVDDEPIIKKSLTKLIEMKFPQFKVIGYADNGKEAFDLTREHLPDLIITDIRMPEMDGLELIKMVESLEKEIKTVVVSGYDEFEYAQAAIRHGAVDYLLKPIKPEMFYNMLEKVEKQLKSRFILTEETRGWLYQCKEYSEKVMEYLWGVNQSECEELLLTSYKELTAQKIEIPIITGFYMDLYHFVKVGINKRLGQELTCHDLEQPKNDLSPEEVLALLTEWAISVIDYIQEARNWGNFSKVKRAVEYMNSHYADANLTLTDVAEIVNMSPAYFSKQFKEENGKSFISYLTELRMEKAKELLLDIHLKTYEIAEMVGYHDYPHFTKSFKKYHKISPKEYRNLLSS